MIILHTAATHGETAKEGTGLRMRQLPKGGSLARRRFGRRRRRGGGGGVGKEQGPAAADANAGGAAPTSTRLPSSDSVPLIFREKMDVRLESQ